MLEFFSIISFFIANVFVVSNHIPNTFTMKKTLLSIAILLLLSLSTIAQRGVNFISGGNLRTVFDLAKVQNKAVFLEAYAPTCHVCIAFKPTFENQQVGDIYNKNYISYKLDMTSPEAAGFLQKQNIWIPSTPTLLFFDKDVKLMHVAIMGENTNSPEALISSAMIALNPQKRATGYKAIYQSGNRTANFLIDYGYMARILKDTVMNITVLKTYAKSIPTTQYTSNVNFAVLQKAIIDDENPLFVYMINHLAEFNAKFDKNLVKQTAENIIMYSLYSSRGSKFSSAKIAQIKANLAKLGVTQKAIGVRVFREEATALFREGKSAEAIKILESIIDAKTDKASYAYLSNFVKSRTSDKAALAKATVWAAKGR